MNQALLFGLIAAFLTGLTNLQSVFPGNKGVMALCIVLAPVVGVLTAYARLLQPTPPPPDTSSKGAP